MSEPFREWRFERYEKIALISACASLLVFGLHIERRTALRRSLRFTDLGVYPRAAWAVRSGENLYTVSDSNDLHYNYPPAFAILFTPLARPPWKDPATLLPEKQRTEANTPWGYDIAGHKQFYGLHRDNFRFFCIVWIWYGINVVLELLRFIFWRPSSKDGNGQMVRQSNLAGVGDGGHFAPFPWGRVSLRLIWICPEAGPIW